MEKDQEYLISTQGNQRVGPVELQPTRYMLPQCEPQPLFKVHLHQNAVLGARPTLTSCMRCQKNVMTRLVHEVDAETHWAAVRFCLACLCPCALLPYCMKYFKVGRHYCSECGLYIGRDQENSKTCCC